MADAEYSAASELVDRWQPVTVAPGDAAREARAVLLHAVQPVAAVGRAVRPTEGAPVGRLEWTADHCALATGLLEGARPFRAAVRVGALTLLMLDVDDMALKTLPLDGAAVERAREWLTEQVAALGGTASVEGTAWEVPALPADLDGKLSRRQRESFESLERWYGNAQRVLGNVAHMTRGASAVHCEPETGTLQTRIELPSRQGEATRAIRAGMVPGDEWRSQPYWFVQPSAHDEVETLPELPSPARWEHVGGFAAVLPGDELARWREPDTQARTVHAFFESGLQAAHEILRREWRRR
jgi:hypothetical protein